MGAECPSRGAQLPHVAVHLFGTNRTVDNWAVICPFWIKTAEKSPCGIGIFYKPLPPFPHLVLQMPPASCAVIKVRDKCQQNLCFPGLDVTKIHGSSNLLIRLKEVSLAEFPELS